MKFENSKFCDENVKNKTLRDSQSRETREKVKPNFFVVRKSVVLKKACAFAIPNFSIELIVNYVKSDDLKVQSSLEKYEFFLEICAMAGHLCRVRSLKEDSLKW